MQIFNHKINREIEKALKLEKNSLKKPCVDLKEKHKFTDQDIKRIAIECANYCLENGNDFTVAFNLYVSCLNNPKK